MENKPEEDPWESLSFVENQRSGLLKKKVVNHNVYSFIFGLLGFIVLIFHVNFYSEIEINKAENTVYIQSLVPLKNKHFLSNLNDIGYVKPKDFTHGRQNIHTTAIAVYDKAGFEIFDTRDYYQTLFFKSSAMQKCSQINNTINSNFSGIKVKLANEFAIFIVIVFVLICILSFRNYISENKLEEDIERFDSIDFPSK